MSNLVIVAIPDENDRVWKVSSEKIPHLTLLFLGDVDKVSNLESIVGFVDHAVNTSLRRFYLTVDRRDELGADSADVLFFKKGYDYKAVHEFRSNLLKDTNIKTAYDSATQFEGPWQPHLTLGYPAAPAKEEEHDYGGFYSVDFNKIAVWIDDYDGPEFLLTDKWDEYDNCSDGVPGDVAWSDASQQGAEFLNHAGVKGMRWGVRKEDAKIAVNKSGTFATASLGTNLALVSTGPAAFLIPRVRQEARDAHAFNKTARADKKLAKADAKWEKKIYTVDGAVKVHNAMADHFNQRIGALNDKYKDTNLDLFERPNDPMAKKYMDEANKLTLDSYTAAVTKVHGNSPSGKKMAQLSDDGESIKIVDADKVKHADDEIVEFLLKRDDKGLILEMNQAESMPDMAQSLKMGEEFLAHYGVKGMQWGRRRAMPEAVSPTATSRVPSGAKRKTKIQVEGGENHPAHVDAIKVAEARAKLSKSGTAALSNTELREVANRLQLENQVKQLTTSSGRKFITNLLTEQGKSSAKATLRDYVSPQPPPKSKNN